MNKINEVISSIKQRRSIRKYLSRDVEEEKIKEIIECARWGPSAKNEQVCHFTVIKDKDLLRKISKLLVRRLSEKYPMIQERAKEKEDPLLYSAPVYVIVSAPVDSHWGNVDGSIAAQNMALSAYSLGLGSCYIGMARTLKDDKEFNELIQIPEGNRVIITMVIGYPDEKPLPMKRKDGVVSIIE